MNLLILPLIVTAIIGALVVVQLLPRIRVYERVALTALVGAVSGLGAIGIVRVFDALPGSNLAESGLVALLVLGVGLTAGAIVRLLGQPALVIAFVIFLVIGVPAAGLTSAPELLLTPWKQVGGLLPPGAVGSALRGTVYFDGALVGRSVLVLLAWAALGAGLHLLLDRRAIRGHWKGKVVLISATAGAQGRAAALLFAHRGARVAGCDIDTARNEETAELVRSAGGEMLATTPDEDLSTMPGAQGRIEATAAAFGRIVDVLYINASVPRFGAPPDVTAGDWAFSNRQEIDIVLFPTQAAWPHLIAAGGGSIIDAGSIASIRGTRFLA